MPSDDYTIALDQEGTAQYAQQVLGYSSLSKSQRAALLQQWETATHQLGHWAQEFKEQMGFVDGSGAHGPGTLHSAAAAGDRVFGGWDDHGNTAMRHSQVMPGTDGDHATRLNGIENA